MLRRVHVARTALRCWSRAAVQTQVTHLHRMPAGWSPIGPGRTDVLVCTASSLESYLSALSGGACWREDGFDCMELSAFSWMAPVRHLTARYCTLMALYATANGQLLQTISGRSVFLNLLVDEHPAACRGVTQLDMLFQSFAVVQTPMLAGS